MIEKSLLFQKYGIKGVVVHTYLWFPLMYVILAYVSVRIMLVTENSLSRTITVTLTLFGVALLTKMFLARIWFIKQYRKR